MLTTKSCRARAVARKAPKVARRTKFSTVAKRVKTEHKMCKKQHAKIWAKLLADNAMLD